MYLLEPGEKSSEYMECTLIVKNKFSNFNFSTAPEMQQTAYTRVDKTDGSDELLP
jgi:hypothetical protein